MYTILKPATLDLASYVGRSMADPNITPARRATLTHIYSAMTPEARERVQAAAGMVPATALRGPYLVVDNDPR